MGLKAAGAKKMLDGLGTVYLGLLVGNTEVTGGSYVRVAVATNQRTVANGVLTVTRTGDFSSAANGRATANWGDLTKWGIWDASTSGNLLLDGSILDSSNDPVTITIQSGDTANFATNAFTITLGLS